MQCRFGSVMLQAVTVAFAILAMDVGEALESDQAIFALARAGGKLFAGSRSGDVGVFGHLSLAQQAARACNLRGNDREAPDLPGTHPLVRAALAPCYATRAPLTDDSLDIRTVASADAHSNIWASDRPCVLDGRGV
jgi:hypothetical protein